MKLYGYEPAEATTDEFRSAALAEVTLSATPAELRAMAKFFAHCADEMDRMGEHYSHMHLADRVKSFADSPHRVVMRG